MNDDFLGPLFDQPEPDDLPSDAEPALPENCLFLPAPLPKKPGELERLEAAYRYCKHLPKVIFEEPDDEE